MKRNIITVLLIALTMIVGQTIANNITIDSNPQPVNEDPANKYMDIQFDISWDNSWRTDTATLTPDWWDAAWVFIKYKIGDDGTWKHCHLSASAGHHSITNDNSVAGTIEPVADSMGVFMYRSSGGTGSNNWDSVQLRWYYGSEPDVGTDYIEFKVFALEMVYVPEGAYELGDGIGSNSTYQALGRFCQADDINTTYSITTENGFNLGGASASDPSILSINDDKDGLLLTRTPKEDFIEGDSIVALSDDFPKGFSSFYMMKYELSQKGYVDFLNTLTRSQQNGKVQTDIIKTNITNIYVMNDTDVVLEDTIDNAICCKSIQQDITSPIEFYCDYDEDGIYNEANDGGTLAMNMISSYDLLSYLDWAGLRPMSEFEFEKACRGPINPVTEEYSWGTSSYTLIDAVNNYTFPNASSNTAGANLSAKSYPGEEFFKILRTGIFATSSSNREEANSSYYGIIDLSGNVEEYAIVVGSWEGRIYKGDFGDGYLKNNGRHDVASWPNLINGIGLRGGTFNEYMAFGNISDRFWAMRDNQFRHRSFGLRGVR